MTCACVVKEARQLPDELCRGGIGVRILFRQGFTRDRIRMEARYLKENLSCLTACLAEVAEKRPHDPIEFIAFWLKKQIKNEHFKSDKEEEAKQLQREKEEEAIEQERRAKRLEEARQLSEEEAERRKAEEEKRQREAASASKLPVVEEKEEPADAEPAAQTEEGAAPADDTPPEESVTDQTADEGEPTTTEGDATEQEGEKTEQEESAEVTQEETSGEPAPVEE